MTHPKLALVNRENGGTEKIVNDVLNTIKVLQGSAFPAIQAFTGLGPGATGMQKVSDQYHLLLLGASS